MPHLVYAPFPSDAEVRTWPSSFVIDITDTMPQKLEAIAAYKSQFDEGRIEKVKHYVKSAGGFFGGRCGFTYGEMFALPHPVGGEDLMKVVLGGRGSYAAVQLPGKDHLPLQ